MSEITTEDCKSFIRKSLGLTSEISIKRERKYKDTNGDNIRVFKFNDTTCSVKEDKNGKLSFIDNAEVVEKVKPIANTKAFNAKSFLKKHIKKLENEDYDSESDENAMDIFVKETTNLSSENKVKVANEFSFFFPDLTYNNETAYVTNGLKTPMIGNNSTARGESCFCILFYDSLDSDPDLYVSDILRGILPEYFDKMDEYHFELTTFDLSDETIEKLKALTIEEMIAFLEGLGFKYKNNPDMGDEECMLSKLGLK